MCVKDVRVQIETNVQSFLLLLLSSDDDDDVGDCGKNDAYFYAEQVELCTCD